MPAGHLKLACAASCPAPLVMSLNRPWLDVTDAAEALTMSTQSGWKVTAGDVVSFVMHTVMDLPGVPASIRPPISVPKASMCASCISSFSNNSRVSSSGARMSMVNLTCPGMVFTLPGDTSMMPVVATASCLVARRWQCRMSRDARSEASARSERGVVPEWAPIKKSTSRRLR